MGNLNRKQSKYAGRNTQPLSNAAADGMGAPLHSGAMLGLTCLSETSVATCSDDKTIAIFDVATRKTTRYCRGHTKAVNRVVSNSNHIWSCSRDLGIKLWDSVTAECLMTIPDAHTLNVAGISYCDVNKQLASGSRDYHVKTWDAETGACINEYTAPRNIVTCLDHDPSGNLLYQVCSEVPIGIAHADGRVLQGSEDLCVRVWDTRSSSSMPAMYIGGYVYFPLSISLSQHDGGIHVATGCKGFNSVGCNVKVFDIRSLKHSIIADMTGHAHDVSGVQFMNSGQLLSASKDGTIRIWSPQTGTECAKYAHDMDLQYTSIGYHRNQSGSTTKFFASSFSGVLSEFTITSETSNNGPDSDPPVIRVDYMTGPGAQTTVDS